MSDGWVEIPAQDLAAHRAPDMRHALELDQDALADAIGGTVVRLAPPACGRRLRAVVLTGSLARGEATFLRRERGWASLGDADFFLVFDERRGLPADSATQALSREIEAALAREGLFIHIGLAPVERTWLRRLPPHIASYELRECGRVLWGDRDVLSLVPRFSASDISPEDAWRLLANRMLEALEAVALHAAPEELHYRMTKLSVDLGTSYLVFAGRYRPTYGEREQALWSAAGDERAQNEAPFSLEAFARHVSACTRAKLDPDAAHAMPLADLSASVQAFTRPLWRWELSRLGGGAGTLSDGELMRRWMACQPARQTLRGWGSLLRRCGWLRNWRQWPRWMRLARRASPRYRVYAATAELFFALPEPAAEANWAAVARQLPLLRHTGPLSGADGRRRLAREAAWNYRQFLETTRA